MMIVATGRGSALPLPLWLGASADHGGEAAFLTDDAAAGQSPLRGRRVLVVEDEVFIALDLEQALGAVGADVVRARTVSQALQAVSEEAFDVAVLDVTLGRSETCRPVAAALREAGTPFLLHSGDLDRQGEVITGLDAPLVPKPAPADAVVRAAARLLEAPLGRG